MLPFVPCSTGSLPEPMPLMSSSIRRVFDQVEDEARSLTSSGELPVEFCDMLERLRGELNEEAHQSDAAARFFFDLSLDILVVADEEARLLRVSPSFERSLGYAPSEVVGRNVLEFVHPDDHDATVMAARVARAGKPLKDFENRYVAKSGDVRILRWIFVTTVEGRIYAIARDETERHEREADLDKTHRLLTDAQRIAHVGNWIFDIGTESLSWSAETFRIFGMDPDGQPPAAEEYPALIHPDDRDELLETWWQRRQHGGPPVESTHRIVRPDGTERIVYECGEIVTDADGKPVLFHGTVLDVTERELALQRMENLVRAKSTLLGLSRALLAVDTHTEVGRQVVEWVEQLGEGSWTASFWIESEGDWNVVETHAPATIQEREKDIISRLRRVGRKRLWNVLEEPASFVSDNIRCIPCPLSDGQTACIVIHHAAHNTALDSTVAEALALQVVSAMNNITAREHVRELMANLFAAEESERRKLARDLHDEAGATLTGLQISLELYRRKLAESSASKDDLTHLQTSIDATLELVNQIRSVAMRLRPSILDDFGIVVALNWLAENVSQQDGLDVSFSADFNAGERFSAVIETALFRVVQESLTNALRHADAQQATVQLSFVNNELHLSVTDNGVGFNPRTQSLKRATAGIGGMRERVRLAGGIFQIRSKPGKSTVVNARIPAVVRRQGDSAS